MNVVMIVFGAILVLLALALGIKWKRTDWKRIDEQNKAFVDENGDHAYYDRHAHDKW